MSRQYKEFKKLDFPTLSSEVLAFWKSHNVFKKSITHREGCPKFTFYEGPPSANGKPGIHHVMGRTIKDIFCRYKTMQGYQVKRRGGWDTHGLPVELQVEKQLGISRDDIGKEISIATYNRTCRETVMKYKKQWDELTVQIGFWVDLENPYITYEKDYIQNLWCILKKFYERDLLYKGYSIQPYSPAAGTGLSSHELNLPGCYKEVKDTSVVAQFKIIRNDQSEFLFTHHDKSPQENAGVIEQENIYALAWTTTPWTLPSNTALAVGEMIKYLLVATTNPYTNKSIKVIIAKKVFKKYFKVDPDDDVQKNETNNSSQHTILGTWSGKSFIGISYEQLMPYVAPQKDKENAFQMIAGDFVTTEEGTGIVHISPTFGADDLKVASLNNIPSITLMDEEGNPVPTVDQKGKLINEIGEPLVNAIEHYEIKTHKPLGRDDFYVKNYTEEDESSPNYKTTDTIIAIILKEENKAFLVEKYVHSYPHCWRTHKPIIYYPLTSWFIRTTSAQKRMIELNKTITWYPPSTGSGRFGNWLENLVDWNLSRSRYWGTPLPIWQTKDGSETKCIGSLEELKNEVEKAVKAGITNPTIQYDTFDPHKPYVDEIILVTSSGQPMYRESDLIDVWFDSGAMPYAQWNYPFQHETNFKESFPADYVAEGVDQTRGWFFTLHAIAVLLYDSVAFKRVLSNGLVLDKKGNKMSKSKDNTVDPFALIKKYGSDSVRWYMIENAPPWENLKFDEQGIMEVQRKFFHTLFNVYSFFALYANIDGFVNTQTHHSSLPTQPSFYLDKWILSRLQSLTQKVLEAYQQYDATSAARALQQFVNDHLSNWYIRLSRKRFWQPSPTSSILKKDKREAYETLYECLMTVCQLTAPIAPFFSDWMYRNLIEIELTENANTTPSPSSIHLTNWNQGHPKYINKSLEQSMKYAQRISSLAHSLRKKNKIKVRTPLRKLLLLASDQWNQSQIRQVEDLIKSEINVKTIDYIPNDAGILVKKANPNYSKLGREYGARMQEIASVISTFTKDEISTIEKGSFSKGGFDFTPEDIIITSEDISGWSTASDGIIMVALDITITEELKAEGIARDFVNRIQHLRKEKKLDVMDKINLEVVTDDVKVSSALAVFKDYIITEIQALHLDLKNHLEDSTPIEIDDYIVNVKININ